MVKIRKKPKAFYQSQATMWVSQCGKKKAGCGRQGKSVYKEAAAGPWARNVPGLTNRGTLWGLGEVNL